MMFNSRFSVEKVKSWYFRYERLLSSVSLVGGFVFDAVTLKRLDLFLENFWIIVHLLVVAVCIIALNFIEKEREGYQKIEDQTVAHFWLLIIIQFAFGGLLSTYIVFYFRSATLASSWPFFLILGVVFACNEIFKHHYSRLTFQISILFISIFSFFIYFLPVAFHELGKSVFLLSGLVSLIVLALYLSLMWYVTKEQFKQSKWILGGSIAAIYLLINILYFTNIIPPIPLSLKEAGVYHSVIKDSQGHYVVKAEHNDSWLSFFNTQDTYNEVAGQPVYVYSAVFSPTSLNTTVVHNWQQYDSKKNEWISKSKVVLPIVGGRDGGYRTYSTKSNISPGLWRVDVETPSGQDIGRIKFEIKSASTTPDLITKSL